MKLIDYMKLALRVVTNITTGEEVDKRIGYIFRYIDLETGERKKDFIDKSSYSDQLFREYAVNNVVFDI